MQSFYGPAYYLNPWVCLIIAAAFAGPWYLAARKAAFPRPHWPYPTGAITWLAYAANEAASRAQGANIRIDILMLWPLVAVLTSVCIVRIVMAWCSRNAARPFRT